MTRWPGHAVLQVPVPPLDEWVRGEFHRHDPSLLGRDAADGAGFVHAHVTVLGPFDEPPDEDLVQSIALAHQPFVATCDAVRAFPNGIIHAPAGPEQDFRALTRTARTVFPDVLPYRGQFGVTPHVTLGAVDPDVTVAGIRTALTGLLPVDWLADRLDLVWYEQDNTHLVSRHELGAHT